MDGATLLTQLHGICLGLTKRASGTLPDSFVAATPHPGPSGLWGWCIRAAWALPEAEEKYVASCTRRIFASRCYQTRNRHQKRKQACRLPWPRPLHHKDAAAGPGKVRGQDGDRVAVPPRGACCKERCPSGSGSIHMLLLRGCNMYWGQGCSPLRAQQSPFAPRGVVCEGGSTRRGHLFFARGWGKGCEGGTVGTPLPRALQVGGGKSGESDGGSPPGGGGQQGEPKPGGRAHRSISYGSGCGGAVGGCRAPRPSGGPPLLSS